jgi:hypothetical protein
MLHHPQSSLTNPTNRIKTAATATASATTIAIQYMLTNCSNYFYNLEVFYYIHL